MFFVVVFVLLSDTRSINFSFEFVFHPRACYLLRGVCREYWFKRFYLLVFLTLQMLFSYCAHLVGGSNSIVLQLVQDLTEPKPSVELHAI